MADRPGFQYPAPLQKAEPSALNGIFKNYGDNILWLSGQVESLQSTLAQLRAQPAPVASPGSGFTVGTYTPLVIAGVNVTEAVGTLAQWVRWGDTVLVSGVLIVTPTATGPCSTDMELPFPSNFTDRVNVAGTAVQEGGPDAGSVLGNTLTRNANVEWTATSTAAYNVAYIYLYRILSGFNLV